MKTISMSAKSLINIYHCRCYQRIHKYEAQPPLIKKSGFMARWPEKPPISFKCHSQNLWARHVFHQDNIEKATWIIYGQTGKNTQCLISAFVPCEIRYIQWFVGQKKTLNLIFNHTQHICTVKPKFPQNLIGNTKKPTRISARKKDSCLTEKSCGKM